MSRDENRPGMPEGVRRAFRLPWRGKAQTGSDIDDEVAFHLEMRTAALRAAGLTADAARSEALRRFGDPEEFRDYCQTIDAPYARRALASRRAQGWAQDVRFAVRQLRRTPAFTVIAVLTLALGIGANTAIFSVVQHVLLAPVPYRGGDRIVRILESIPPGNQAFITPQAQTIRIWQARAHTLDQIVGYLPGEVTFSDGPTPEAIVGASIAADMLPFLGVRPALGRNFAPADTSAGAAPVAMIGYGLWQRRYGGRSDVLGRLVNLNGKTFVVIGVMPPGLGLPFEPAEPGIWMPLHLATPSDRMQVMGRLRSGNSSRDATKELTAIAATAPGVNRGAKHVGAAMVSTRKDMLGDSYRRTLIMLFAAVGLVLLIACANVANLLLVRAGSREREFAVRAALGAGRGRLVRQVLTESMLLALAGCAVGLLLAWRGLHLIIALSPAELDGLAGVRMEPTVLAWSIGVSILTGLIFGLAPAFLATERTIGESLKSSTRSASGNARARRVRGTLIVGEIALSVVLLVGAGLLFRSFSALEQVDPGFDPRGLVGVSVDMPREYFASDVSRNAAITQILDGVRRIPGVQSAAVGSDMPPNGGVAFGDLQIAGRTIATSAQVSIVGYAMAGENYFRVVGVLLREGRIFTPSIPPTSASGTAKSNGGPREIMISQRFAKRFWPGGGAVGARIRLGDTGDWLTIVGVAGDVQLPGDLGAVSDLRMYTPFSAAISGAEIIVRSKLPSGTLVPQLNAAITRASPYIRVHKAKSAESVIAEAVAQPRFAMTLIGAFALLALTLAVVGLYGVIAYSVSQRTREVGIRIALGAQPRDVVALVMRHGFTLVALGIALGVAAAIGATRVIQSLLFGVGSTDLISFVIAGALTALVTSLACYIPARRAALIDPLTALRAD
ncbi:MAG: ABC transporter permease [Gemmatimonadaceae bacterium]